MIDLSAPLAGYKITSLLSSPEGKTNQTSSRISSAESYFEAK